MTQSAAQSDDATGLSIPCDLAIRRENVATGPRSKPGHGPRHDRGDRFLEAARPLIVEFLRPIVAEIVAESRDDFGAWIDQTETKLGRRTHINLVRKMIAEGKPGAARKARRHFLTRAVHDDELAKVSLRAPKPNAMLAQEYLA